MNELSLTTEVELNDGHAIPQLGFGVFQITDPEECATAVKTALDVGYRHFDTATVYQNEAFLGRTLEESGVAREDLFLTTKCWISDFGRESTRAALETSLSKLKTDYVDLYLLHWPEDGSMMAAWEALLAMREEGKCRSIGVSNFTLARFEKFFFTHTDEVPAVNQIEQHPLRSQGDTQAYCEEKGIAVESYSPLARAECLSNPELKRLAEETGKTPAQVILRWHLQHDRIVIPKSVHPERIRQNAEVFDFDLSDDQMARVDALNRDESVISWRPNDGKGWY